MRGQTQHESGHTMRGEIPRGRTRHERECAVRAHPRSPLRSRGFALVPVVFLIVVVALLATIALRVSIGQQQTVTVALQQARALAAARAGIDWAAYSALNGTCTGGTLNLTEASLNGYTVTVTCSATAFTEGNASYQSYSIAATATSGSYGTADFVQRVVRATFTSAT
jgi:MSHA biogenesis protein MshP